MKSYNYKDQTSINTQSQTFTESSEVCNFSLAVLRSKGIKDREKVGVWLGFSARKKFGICNEKD